MTNQNENTKKHKIIRLHYSFTDAVFNFIGVLIAPMIFVLMYTILISILAGSVGQTLAEFSQNYLVKTINSLVIYLAFLFVLLSYSKNRNIKVLKATGFKFNLSAGKTITVIIIAISTLYLISPLINLLNYLFTFIGFNPSQDLNIDVSSPLKLVIAIITLAFIPAVLEEFIFRGVILKGLLSKFSVRSAVIWSAVMFMLMHGSLQQTVFQLILGIILAYVAINTKNLIYPIILHFINNTMVAFSYYFSTLGNAPEVESALSFGPVDIAVVVVFTVVAIALITMLVKLLKYNSVSEFLNRITFGKNQTKNNENIIIVNQTIKSENGIENIVVEVKSNKMGFKSLTKNEKIIFFASIAVASLNWIINTLSIILGI